MFTLSHIKSAIQSNNLQEAIEMATEYLQRHPEESKAYFLRGKAYWRLGDKPSAITDYESAVQLDPTSPASAALSHAKDIMNYFNPDILNP